MTFKSGYKKLERKMEEEGKIKTLSKQQTYSLENNLSKGLSPIKQEFYKKHNASRNYINKLEQISIQV
jgi:predicted transcriptional regulator